MHRFSISEPKLSEIEPSGQLPRLGRIGSHKVKLLISVQDPAEALTALHAQADWIDLKDPKAGALGAAALHVAEEVAQVLVAHPQRSAALGELTRLDELYAERMTSFFPVLKVGLSNANQIPDWKLRFHRFSEIASAAGSVLVPVIYADWRTCNAPPPPEVVELSKELRSKYVLLDTYAKQGRNLFSWMSPTEARSIVSLLEQQGSKVILAGSIQYEMLDELLTMPVEAIGIRGAVCGGGRSAPVCPNKLRSWVARFNSQ